MHHSPLFLDSQKSVRALKNVGWITGFSALCATVYTYVATGANPHGLFIGFFSGTIIVLVVSVAEMYLFQNVGRRLPFTVLLLSRSIFYFVLSGATIIMVMAFHYTVMHDMEFMDTFRMSEFDVYLERGEFRRDVFAGMAIIIGASFLHQINRLLGQGVLWKYLSGRYHTPVEEERVFMFLDLNDSTSLAERLGNVRYHQLLNDFFHDISSAVVESKGEIYQYVGDEVVVTWTKERGLTDANCIKCYFRIATALHRTGEKYEKKYGLVPGFKAGYHFGPVVSGEVGDIKRDIVFHGDTVNTASRIRSECSTFGRNLLLSSDLLQRLNIREYLSPESIGKIRLKGKESDIELYTIKEAA